MITGMNKPAKPTGEAGVVKVSRGILGAKAKVQKLEFPTTKVEIETFVVNAFLPGATKCGLLPEGTTAQQNREQDLDFTLTFIDGDSGELELMEIAHLEDVRGSYSDAPSDNNSYEFAEKLIAKIKKKSDKYGSVGSGKRHLLIYPTDWKFIPSMTADKLIRYWLATKPHNFVAVYQFIPVTADDGPMSRIYPTNDDWKGFDPEAYRQSLVTNFDPNKWEAGMALPVYAKVLIFVAISVLVGYTAVQQLTG